MITRDLASYDIADPDRLRRVHNVVKASAVRVQDSASEALMTDTGRVLDEDRLKCVINEKEDQVMFVDLWSADRTELPEITTLGLPSQPQSHRCSAALASSTSSWRSRARRSPDPYE